ncbi:hypothetical protein [Rubrivivax rivuli]|uniref:Uncharacterized protein n=1 Tax=Rubrivivax rivuli TaxID=1862385 RepID=A0A437RSI7_9BURK|nr:hypothetical protein [Rubrivivax rivuli]RVU49724.1 hypothetical protein EOE66_04010 [Rubrivivax rivuli]
MSALPSDPRDGPARPPPRPLAEVLREAGAELQGRQPPPRLLRQLRAAMAPRPWWQRVWAAGPRAPAAAFATVLVGTALLLVMRPAVNPPLVDEALQDSGFVAVAPPQHWPQSDTPAWLVSTELQRERLATLGLPFDPSRAGEAVRAELLLHPSGEVLAVRLLN